MITKLLYLGPSGSYCETAVKKFSEHFSNECDFEPIESIYKITKALKDSNNKNLAAVIPLENSIEGIVKETQDNLINLAKNNIRILAETSLFIEHSLIGFGKKEDVKTITSHPQALAQCREYILKNWEDNVTLQPVLSTSNAVSSLTKDDVTVAAIGNNNCAKLYNVPVIESKINDEDNNTTRFVLLSLKRPTKKDNNKVCITFSTENKPGALNQVLKILENHSLNMSYISSRPSRRELGEYIFYVDFYGHIEDANVHVALREILPYIKTFEILSEGAICI